MIRHCKGHLSRSATVPVSPITTRSDSSEPFDIWCSREAGIVRYQNGGSLGVGRGGDVGRGRDHARRRRRRPRVYGSGNGRRGQAYEANVSSVYVRRQGDWELAVHVQVPHEEIE